MSVMISPFPLPVTEAQSVPPVRPATFREHYVATRPTPYSFVPSSLQPTSSGGVLRRGQAVWLEQTLLRTRLLSSVQAFVENVGFVALDGRLIKKSDGST